MIGNAANEKQIIIFTDYQKALLSGMKGISPTSPHPLCVTEAVKYLDQHFRENISVDQLAATLFVSRSHLMHMFKRATGQGVHEYLTGRRIDYATGLIRLGMSIQESSELAGYEDYSLFYRNFIKRTGISPKEYQRNSGSSSQKGEIVYIKEYTWNHKFSGRT